MAFAYFKDKFLPESECHISIHDRSFRFGDGIFETCLVAGGVLYDFKSHLKRIKNGLIVYKIIVDISNLENICNELIKKNSVNTGFLRIMVSRGENNGSSVGYKPGSAAPYLLIQAGERPYPAFKEISLWTSSYSAAISQPSKTNSSMLYTMALMEASEYNCDNALLVNRDEYICETASGNIFWIKNDVLYTPSLDLEIIPGTTRARVLALWEGNSRQGNFRIDDLHDTQEVFMTGIGCIIAPVTSILPYGGNWPVGNITQSLRKKLDEDILRSCSIKTSGK